VFVLRDDLKQATRLRSLDLPLIGFWDDLAN
jgi:hypothetical protein